MTITEEINTMNNNQIAIPTGRPTTGSGQVLVSDSASAFDASIMTFYPFPPHLGREIFIHFPIEPAHVYFN